MVLIFIESIQGLWKGSHFMPLKKFLDFSRVSPEFVLFFLGFSQAKTTHLLYLSFQIKLPNQNFMETRMHSSRMRTARSLPYRGGLNRNWMDRDSPAQRPPLNRDPLWKETPGPRCPDRKPQTETRWTETPLWTETPPSEQRPSWTETPCGQTNTYENITFTNFVCGR